MTKLSLSLFKVLHPFKAAKIKRQLQERPSLVSWCEPFAWLDSHSALDTLDIVTGMTGPNWTGYDGLLIPSWDPETLEMFARRGTVTKIEPHI